MGFRGDRSFFLDPLAVGDAGAERANEVLTEAPPGRGDGSWSPEPESDADALASGMLSGKCCKERP